MTFLSLRVKILVGFTAIFSLAFWGSHHWFFQFATRRATDLLYAELQETALATAAGVDVDELMALARDRDRQRFAADPRYRHQLDWLEAAHRLNPHVWTSVFMGGGNQSQADAEESSDEIVYLMDVRTNHTPERARRTLATVQATTPHRQALNGNLAFSGLRHDRWGAWLTVYVPLKDDTGMVVAALGADISAREIMSLQKSIRDRLAISFCLSYGTLSLAIFWLSGILTAPLRRLQTYAQAIGEGQYDASNSPLPPQWLVDETGELSRVLTQVAGNIQAREEWMRAIFEQAGVGVAICEVSGELRQVNATFCRLLGYDESDLLGRSEVALTHADDRVASLARTRRCLRGDLNTYTIEKRYLRKDGRVVWANLATTLVRDRHHQPQYFIAIATDISDRKQVEAELTQAAYFDALTQLPNRTKFMARLERLLARSPGLFAVLLVDLDDFKTVNDSLGHLAGDRLLVWIGKLLSACVRGSDTVARLGGDEFAILLDPIGDLAEAEAVAERIQQRLQQPIHLENREYRASVSIGIALNRLPETGEPYNTLASLLRDADAAMYRAKERGKGCHAVFDRQVHQNFSVLLQERTALQLALEREEFCLYYQPIVCAQTGKLRGLETLLHWQHPERGLLGPEAFLELASQTRLLAPLGEWILQTACQQLKTWQDCHWVSPEIFASINVSGAQLERGLLTHQVQKALNATQLDPTCLQLEIVEMAIAGSLERAAQTLGALRVLGVKIGIDDFGTGYSSLMHLQRFPVDLLEVDRTFVEKLSQDPEHTELVRAILTLAANLGLQSVAEGVETPEQLAMLQEFGCTLVQGNLFARPMDANTLGTWLAPLNPIAEPSLVAAGHR